MKRPEYDGNACMLYDFMVSQGLTEESVMHRMGLDIDKSAPWYPVSIWIQELVSIPRHYMASLCSAVNAPLEAVFIKSRLLNDFPFHFCECVGKERKKLEDIPADELIGELKRRGYKVYKEV